jgi:hypothetical protein
MAGGGDGIVFIPWYATGFRGDALEEKLREISAVAMRYGATEHAVYRSRDDRYKLLQTAAFADKTDWERYWYGEEFAAWRTDYLGYYQVPVVYTWADLVISGSLAGETERLATAPPEGDTI